MKHPIRKRSFSVVFVIWGMIFFLFAVLSVQEASLASESNSQLIKKQKQSGVQTTNSSTGKNNELSMVSQPLLPVSSSGSSQPLLPESSFSSAHSFDRAGEEITLLPESWRACWQAPERKHRPIQILHGWLKGWSTMHKTSTWDFSTFTHPGEEGVADRPVKDVSRIFDELGLGGVVCNVGGERYFRDPAQWDLLVKSVRAFAKAGLRVWIYDEQGYPSLGAGGLVLEKDPNLESLALCYDADLEQAGKDPFIVRPAFEYTHPANNVRVLRRYPNPLDPRSTKLFISLTHEQYRQKLGQDLFNKIEAFFFDEPSITAFNMSGNPGRVLPSMQNKVDPSIKNLPMVPWVKELPAIYQTRFHEDLLKQRKSIFIGDSAKDKKIRSQFWSVVADLNRESFYGQIQDYLRSKGSSVPTMGNLNAPVKLCSSGHLLGEEGLTAHVAHDGNKLANTMRMDLPGLDVLSSNPQAFNWMTAGIPCSAAFLKGHRLVMSEISDMADYRFRKPYRIASFEWMTSCTGAQAAWGVTEFASYYRFENLGKDVYKKYCDYVGRLNSVLRNAKPVRPVLLLYPVEEMQQLFKPGYPISKNQSKEMNFLLSTFRGLGHRLMINQIPFTLIDRNTLEQALPTNSGTVELASLSYDTIFVPTDLPLSVEKFNKKDKSEIIGNIQKTDNLKQADKAEIKDKSPKTVELKKVENIQKTDRTGIKVIRTTDSDYFAQIQKIREHFIDLTPGSESIIAGQFEKDGRRIWVLVNMSEEKSYSGQMTRCSENQALVLDPVTGKVQKHSIIQGKLPVELKPLETLLYVF